MQKFIFYSYNTIIFTTKIKTRYISSDDFRIIYTYIYCESARKSYNRIYFYYSMENQLCVYTHGIHT